MNQSETSWTRCAEEFAAGTSRPSIIVKIPLERTKYVGSSKPVQVKKATLKNQVSRRSVVATDIALANLDQIETSESVVKWIAGAICTPPNSPSRGGSPVVEREAEEPLTKSPTVGKPPAKHKKRYFCAATKSPIFKKRKREAKNCAIKFGPWETLLLNRSSTQIASDKSVTPEIRSFAKREKFVPSILRKGALEDPTSGNKSLRTSDSELNQKKNEPQKIQEPETNDETIFDNVNLSQDLFDDDIISATPQIPRIRSAEKRTSDDKEAGLLGRAPQLTSSLWIKDPESRLEIKLEEDYPSSQIVQDTEDLLGADSSEKYPRPSQGPWILETEVTPEKKKYVANTERIDFESSSENEERERRDSDSDKTVSDLIEEPITQDSVEPSKPSAILNWKLDHTYSQRISNYVLSPKISEILSFNEQNSPQISVVDISTETTPPRTQESPGPVVEPFDSPKKKKSRPKKGSLGARLQKLISAQASSVRLWRHQMSRESGFVRSARSTTLLVTEARFQYGKNLYRSKIVEDPYDLINFWDDKGEGGKGRSLVVMTNPEFVGPVRMRAGSVFKMYNPWDVMNHCSEKGIFVIHSLYFSVVSNPAEVKTEPSDDQSVIEELRTELVRKYDCPCLRSGKLEDSCLTKFTHHKVDVIAEMIKI